MPSSGSHQQGSAPYNTPCCLPHALSKLNGRTKKICPSTLRGVWNSALTAALPGVAIRHVRTGKDAAAPPPPAPFGVPFVTIVSWSLTLKLVAANLPAFGAVIADETHKMKSPDAACTKAAVKFLRDAKRVALLSGTPALNRPFELYEQVRGHGWRDARRALALVF